MCRQRGEQSGIGLLTARAGRSLSQHKMSPSAALRGFTEAHPLLWALRADGTGDSASFIGFFSACLDIENSPFLKFSSKIQEAPFKMKSARTSFFALLMYFHFI